MLNRKASVELFLNSCGKYSDQDIVDFVMADESYPFAKILPELKQQDVDVSRPESKHACSESILKLIRSKGYAAHLDLMQQHDMFKQMRGNPTSITLIAAIHANPMYKKAKNELVDMY